MIYRKGMIQIGAMIAMAGVMITGFGILSARFMGIENKITSTQSGQTGKDDEQNQRIAKMEEAVLSLKDTTAEIRFDVKQLLKNQK